MLQDENQRISQSEPRNKAGPGHAKDVCLRLRVNTLQTRAMCGGGCVGVAQWWEWVGATSSECPREAKDGVLEANAVVLLTHRFGWRAVTPNDLARVILREAVTRLCSISNGGGLRPATQCAEHRRRAGLALRGHQIDLVALDGGQSEGPRQGRQGLLSLDHRRDVIVLFIFLGEWDLDRRRGQGVGGRVATDWHAQPADDKRRLLLRQDWRRSGEWTTVHGLVCLAGLQTRGDLLEGWENLPPLSGGACKGLGQLEFEVNLFNPWFAAPRRYAIVLMERLIMLDGRN